MQAPLLPNHSPFFSTAASLYSHYSFPQASLCLYKDKQLFSALRRMLPLRVFANVINLGKVDDLQINSYLADTVRYSAVDTKGLISMVLLATENL